MKTQQKMKNGTIKIGNCSVDSGQLMIVDPCYVDSFVNDEFDNQVYDLDEEVPFSYSGACNVTLHTPAQGGQLGNGTAVATSTGWGDGSYPVYAEIEDGRVASVTIYFNDEPKYIDECLSCGAIECECEDEDFYNNDTEEEGK
jgi:hypothetical protein